MHVETERCGKTVAGVDLNRNYGFMFGEGDGMDTECADNYRGKYAFSEPETRAIRDFVVSKKEEIKFVYNFHCAGKQIIIPLNGEFPNTLATKFPELN